KPYRDEMIISSKAGYGMWSGPYGDWGSKKYMIASLDQSLKRMGLDYVDIFYSHRPDPNTPLEETMGALDQVVRQGKALYVGISNYSDEQTAEAVKILNNLGTPLLIHQPSYSMLNRWIEDGLQDVLEQNGIGSIAFCPLQQGLLTNKYLGGVPDNSRAAKPTGALHKNQVTEAVLRKVEKLNEIAVQRGQSLAQMALAWVLRDGKVTSALIGASRVEQIEDNVAALNNLHFSTDELAKIDEVLNSQLISSITRRLNVVGRHTELLNLNWKFFRGEEERAWYKGLDDSNWRNVTLPHDWSVEEPFSKEYSSGTGYLPGGIGWYRKKFLLPEDMKGKRVYITFEGVYNNSQVWCNSYYIGKRPYGYSTFTYDITDFITFGEENLISVKVNHKDIADSRWFTGSGIYRDVYLTITDQVHIDQYGVFVTTPQVTKEYADVSVNVRLTNETQTDESIDIKNTLVDADGNAIVSTIESYEISAESELEANQLLHV